MKAFARLYDELDASNKTNDKVAALVRYFSIAPDGDKLWALALLSGRRPKRQVNSTQLRQFAISMAGIPLWLFEESYGIVGDLGETVSLLLPPPEYELDMSLAETMQFLSGMSTLAEAERSDAITNAWKGLSQQERLVFTKLITGSFRVGVSQNLVIRALAELTGQTTAELSHRVMGNWSATGTTFDALILNSEVSTDHSRPYPFFLAYAVDDPATLGPPAEWSAEWKWDGIRSQIIKREEQVFIWSRGEDLLTEKFPELTMLAPFIPEGTVIDGEILPFVDGKIGTFQVLQTRIGRKNLTAKALKEAPAICCAYDLLEWKGKDMRERPFSERRAILEGLVKQIDAPSLTYSATVPFESWEQLATLRQESRQNLAEGFMIKRLASTYQTGRKRGDWWKWKIDPLSVDAVMIYAQRGTGRRADLFTDYTFALWEGDKLVPFAKAYSGLTDAEIRQVDRWVKANTLEKFGPVRTVKPELVMEIGFEGLQISNRHKSGVSVRFPRILRWRTDKPMAEADQLSTLREMVAG